MFYELYLITNTINGKKYVGQTTELRGFKKRFNQHINQAYSLKHHSLLHAAIKSYGADKFTVKRLIHGIDASRIDFYEKLWIEKLGTYYALNGGYNMTLGGQGIHGYHHTADTKALISSASTRQWKNLRTNPQKTKLRSQRISTKLKGTVKSPVARYHSSLAAKKRFKNSPGTFTGRKHTQESRDLIASKNGTPILMCDIVSGKPLERFQSAHEARRYLIRKNITSNKTAETRILTVCNTTKTAYGYRWIKVEKV